MKIHALPFLIFVLLLLNADPIIASQTGERASTKRQSRETALLRQAKNIVASGGDVNNFTQWTQWGQTGPLLHVAAQRRDNHALDFLLQHNADPNLNYFGSTPIKSASTPETVRLLFNAGADLDAKSKNWITRLQDLARHMAHNPYTLDIFFGETRMRPDAEIAQLCLKLMQAFVFYGADYSLALTFDNKFHPQKNNKLLMDVGAYLCTHLVPTLRVSEMRVKGMKSLMGKPLDHNKPFNAIKARQYFGTRPKQPRIHS